MDFDAIKKENCFIITGAPGTGKSTLIAEISKRFKTVSEPAREIIAEQKLKGGNGIWEKDRHLFLELLLQKSISNFTKAPEDETVFFDRGIPDCMAYALYGNVKTKEFIVSPQRYIYNKKVFILSPWKKIYKTDDERQMSFDETINFNKRLTEVYNDLGYKLLEVPQKNIQDRLSFIEQNL